ncbi:MAG TPA: hypothetical protein VNJ12_14385 [Candidatus Dormibacteraeota bacterium]|nr:hypothetical protein [Candidatus Dormibacteraeota bacterium]
MTKRLVSLTLAILLTAVVAAAQNSTVYLQDGQQVMGTYLGGTKDQVQMLVNGQVEIFQTSNIASIDFISPETSAASTGSSALSQMVTVPEGTPILIRMIDSVDSSVNKPGDIFHASLEEDLRIGDVVVARKGTDVYGKLMSVQSAGRVTGKSELALELTGIRTVDGRIQPVVTGAYQEAGKSRTKQTVEHSVIGAALGAIIGGVAGGGGGAAKGVGIGAAAGAGVTVITRGQQVKVPSETLLQFQLAQPITITLPKSSS